MANEEVIQAGIEAARAGNLQRAAAIFAGLVSKDPSSEQGWLWLGKCCPTDEQKEYCFRRVLALNPINFEARQLLDELIKPAAPPPAPSSVRPPSPPAEVEKPASPDKPAVSPFIFDETDMAEDASASEAAFPVIETPKKEATENPESPFRLMADASPAQPKMEAKPRKKSNRLLGIVIWSIPVILFCGLAVAYLYVSGLLAAWLPADLFPFLSTPVPVLTLPTPEAGTQTPVAATRTLAQSASPTNTAIPTATALATMKPTLAYAPVLKETKCNFRLPQGTNVYCAYVNVPEDRANPQSEKIQLAVAVYHSSSNRPAPDPVLFLQGGPGAEAVSLAADAYEILVAPFLHDRDFIVFDQRGTGLSKPALGCEELTTVYSQDIFGQIPRSSRNFIYSNAFISCHGAMRVEGVDLTAYTTEASAADVKDVLTALGYKTVDLYGASYGTRLAQVVMRDYPEIVRSSVVDSVVPIETKIYNADPAGVEYVLNNLFAGCRDDPVCNKAYPDLENEFWQLVSKLDSSPVSVTAPLLRGGTITEETDGSTLLSAVLGLLKSSYVSVVPESINQIKNGDYSTLIAMQSSLPFEFEGISPGLYISMMCHEHVLATSAEQLKTDIANSHSIEDFSRLPFFGSIDDMFKTCRTWGAVPPFAGENDPVSNDIPTLIITGKFDPSTPPTWAKLLASHLSNNYYFEFPKQGHTPTAADETGCAMDMVVAFIKDPTKSPDHTCLDKIGKATFIVPYTGNPPLKLSQTKVGELTFKAPAEWLGNGTGFYLRNNSPLDITQLGVLTTFGNSTEILDLLSSKLYGYGGFDSPPIAAGQHDADGQNWSIYRTTSFGRPVDLAMADINHGTRAMVVILFCHADEHDALYQSLFLPVIDSAKYNSP